MERNAENGGRAAGEERRASGAAPAEAALPVAAARGSRPAPHRPLRLCVTGGIACGKSLAGELLAAWGVPVCDADAVYHSLLRPGRPLERRLRRAFGAAVRGADGALDRRALGRLVFADPRQRQRLQRLAHPAVRRALLAWRTAQAARRPRPRIVAAIIPLVYEVGWEAAWDRIVCVAAPESVQRARLRTRGWSAAEARARIAAQWPVEEKMRRADYVAVNIGTPKTLAEQLARIVRALTREMETLYG